MRRSIRLLLLILSSTMPVLFLHARGGRGVVSGGGGMGPRTPLDYDSYDTDDQLPSFKSKKKDLALPAEQDFGEVGAHDDAADAPQQTAQAWRAQERNRDMHKHPDKRAGKERPATILFNRADTELILKGRIRQEYFKGTRTVTMNKQFPDKYNFFRNRADIEFHSRHGKETFGQTAVEGTFKLACFVNWRFSDIYTGMDNIDPFIDGNQGTGFWAQQQLPHRHKNPIPMIFMEESWLKVHFDAIYKWLNKRPHSIQAGFFPYKVGRGISLGDAYEGGISYMGWARPAVGTFTGYTPPHAPHLSPGILFEGSIYENLLYNIYFSKWRATSAFPWTVDDDIHQHIIEPKDQVLFGKTQDADHWAFKLKSDLAFANGLELYFEPYYVNLKSPQHTVERSGDSAVYLNTVGLMIDGRYKQWSFNAEIATQFGKFQMHALDRNRWIYQKDEDTGLFYAHATHVFEHNVDPEFNEANYDNPGQGARDNAFLADPANATLALAAIDSINDSFAIGTDVSGNDLIGKLRKTEIDRLVSQKNGDVLLNPDTGDFSWTDPRYFYPVRVLGHKIATTAPVDGGDPVDLDGGDADKTYDIPHGAQQLRILYNAKDNIQYGGDRFRPAYELKLKGYMALFDLAYEFEAAPVKANFGCGVISGDRYPFNMGEEVNKNYHGFLPLRDINYQGHFIKSLAVFTYRLMPRPLNPDYRDMYARNHTDDTSNLRLLGLGCDWYPTHEPSKLNISSNIVWFWVDGLMYKWDINGVPSNPTWARVLADQFSIDSGYRGWLSNEKASRYLGFEMNTGLDYLITENCELVIRGGIFFPGRLYKDLDGQANLASFTYKPNDTLVAKSLGTDYAWAWNIRLSYRF